MSVTLRGVTRRFGPPIALHGIDLDVGSGEFVALLKREFELDAPEAAGLWDRICARHDELFAGA